MFVNDVVLDRICPLVLLLVQVEVVVILVVDEIFQPLPNRFGNTKFLLDAAEAFLALQVECDICAQESR